MLSKKHISISLLFSVFCLPISANAMMLKPSLYAQMERQNAINIQYEQDKIQMQNEARLNEIRIKNQIRMNQMNEAKPQESEQILSAAHTEVVLDPVEKEKALARVVTRKNQSISTPTENISFQQPQISTTRYNGNIDMRQIEQTWLGWVNSLRQEHNLAPLQIHESLNITAQDWSDFSKNRGYITHARPGDGCTGRTNYSCYNFTFVDKWFQERGVNPKIITRTKHTENIGIGSFRCKASDCTEQAKKAIRKTYNYFLSEKSYNGVHYRTMINPHFKNMGVGLSHSNGTYYLTIHYTTEL